MYQQHSPDDLFALATRLRAAGNEVAKIRSPSMLDRALADADQKLFEDRVAIAQGKEPVHAPRSAFCEECSNVLDADGQCPECEA